MVTTISGHGEWQGPEEGPDAEPGGQKEAALGAEGEDGVLLTLYPTSLPCSIPTPPPAPSPMTTTAGCYRNSFIAFNKHLFNKISPSISRTVVSFGVSHTGITP